MIDLHAHVLPLDDGARNYDEAVEMCAAAAENGIRKIICTPHVISPGYNIDIHKILYSMKRLQGLLKKEHIDIKLIQGAENYLGNSIPINKTKYVLVELPPTDIPVYAIDEIRKLLHNYWVIIAHPEKNQKIWDHPEIVEQLVKLGCYVQVTAESLIRKDVARDIAIDLIEKNMVHFVATDMHRVEQAGNLIKAVEQLKKYSDRPMDLVTTNPEKVIAGKKI
jgi:protein-tyrosine phosphatase